MIKLLINFKSPFFDFGPTQSVWNNQLTRPEKKTGETVRIKQTFCLKSVTR